VAGLDDGAEVGGTLGEVGLAARAADGGEEDADEDRDHADHDEEFDEGKGGGGAPGSMDVHLAVLSLKRTRLRRGIVDRAGTVINRKVGGGRE
jgi:hypothetical protein